MATNNGMQNTLIRFGMRSGVGMRTVTKLAIALAFVFVIAATASATPEVPGAPQKKPVALVGATIHPVNGPIVEGGHASVQRWQDHGDRPRHRDSRRR